jgi:uncharacterized protein (TIGR04255 family)
VLAQVRVAPIAQIDRFLPDIQEALRHLGFPNLVKRKFRITSSKPDVETLSAEEKVQWEYINAKHTCSILVDDGGLVLQSTDYSSGEDFLAQLQIALDAFATNAKPTQLLRVGLRYVDVIAPIGDLSLAALVSPVLREAPLGLPGDPWVHSWETIRRTASNTRLLVRYSEQPKGIAFPSDIGPFISLKLPKPIEMSSSFGLLDSDHFHEEVSDFSGTLVLERIADLHDVLDQSFRKLVTSEALDAWK